MITAEVLPLGRSPALFIDGEPHDGLMYWHRFPWNDPEEVRMMAASGFHLLSFPINIWIPGQETHVIDEQRNPDGRMAVATLDKAGIDHVMERLVELDLGVLVMPRFKLVAPEWWQRENPDEMMNHWLLESREFRRGRWPAITSRKWLATATAALSETVRHFESTWGGHVFGYHPGWGDCVEHAYQWGFPERVLSDYSEPQRTAFRQWLSRCYNGDEQRLRGAWRLPDATFANAEIPRPEQRIRRDRRAGFPRDPVVLNPETERAVIDYMQFHSEAMATAALRSVSVVKETLRGLGRKKICGVFYGYHHWAMNNPQSHNSGHHAHDILLRSPDVDFLCAPNHYSNRQGGGSYAAQLNAASVRAHGKLYYSEDDSGTHLTSREGFAPYVPPTAEAAVNTLRRNFLGAWADGGTQWWMDHAGEGWYRDQRLQTEFASLRHFALGTLNRTDRSSVAEVAVFVSDRGRSVLRHETALVTSLVEHQLLELASLGAPFDCLRIEDLPDLSDEQLARYRVCLFLDTLVVPSGIEQEIVLKLKGGNRTLLWFHTPGLAGGSKWDLETVCRLTGFKLRLGKRDRASLLVETLMDGAVERYGTEHPISPYAIGDDPNAEVLGHYADSTNDSHPKTGEAPGLLRRQHEEWLSIWSAAPAMPARMLRRIVREAGVHLFGERGDQVFAAAGWVGLHAKWDGDVTVKLREQADVKEALTGRVVGAGLKEFTVTLKRGDTCVWSIR